MAGPAERALSQCFDGSSMYPRRVSGLPALPRTREYRQMINLGFGWSARRCDEILRCQEYVRLDNGCSGRVPR
ncbi:hypothetical protein IEO21_07767 [Rhodonia placenta]|uniref:Uncharacterized protein n=1 Tax=Rhodonia placenta TaxID=104341 RepID=A0A8H7U006_9APHY|nr:hypothetical protein IEO21_07767 [Postia placenta]